MRRIAPADWPRIKEIYEAGIAGGDAAFPVTDPDFSAWSRRHLDFGRLAAVVGDVVAGWAALSPVEGPCAYEGVAEVSVYVDPERGRRGIGRRLLATLVQESEDAGIWTLQAQIFPENDASLRLHRSLGFRTVGTRARIGRLNGRWRDVVLLERRSTTVGR